MNITMVVIAAIVVIAGIAAAAAYWPSSPSQYGGETLGPFSYLKEDIAEGNSESWSGRQNVGSDRYNARMERGDGIPTFYGHGIPLSHELRLPGNFDGEPMLIAHNLNPKIAAECCPSPFSTDRGCLCYNTLNSPWR